MHKISADRYTIKYKNELSCLTNIGKNHNENDPRFVFQKISLNKTA